MKEISNFEYLFGRGLRIDYNGTKYRVEEGDIPGAGKNSGTLKIRNKGRSMQLNASVSGLNCMQSNNQTYINGVSLDSLMTGENTRDNDLEEEIEREYTGVKSVALKNPHAHTRLGMSPDDTVYVSGSVIKEPAYRGGHVSVEDLDGKVLLPNTPDIKVDVDAPNGEVSGDVATPGRIQAPNGDISLSLYAPLNVQLKGVNCDVDVLKMVQEKKGFYAPPGVNAEGTLHINAPNGDVELTYMG